MHSKQQQTLLGYLDKSEYWHLSIIGFTILLLERQNIFPTIRFIFQWFRSRFTGSSETYPFPELRLEALSFAATSGAVVLSYVVLLFILCVYFGPIVGFAQLTKELTDEKSKHSRLLQEHINTQKSFKSFMTQAEQHQRTQTALINKSASQIENLNLQTMNTHQAIADLNTRINQLRAISAALGKELDGNDEIQKEEKVDQGDF